MPSILPVICLGSGTRQITAAGTRTIVTYAAAMFINGEWVDAASGERRSTSRIRRPAR